MLHSPHAGLKGLAGQQEPDLDSANPGSDFTIKASPGSGAKGGPVVANLTAAAGIAATAQLLKQASAGAHQAAAASKDGLPLSPFASAPGPAAAPASSPLQLPDYYSVSQFTRLQEVYAGRFSSVFTASCRATGARVVLKRYVKAKMDARARHKMRREVALMRELRGAPGVVQLLGAFEDHHHSYIVMEWAQGGDLYLRYQHSQALGEQWVCTKVITPLLRVLCGLHAAGVVHRDIKPENVFLGPGDELLLGDFGLAIHQGREAPFLRAGTLDYMSPEVLRNPVSDEVDERPGVDPAWLRARGFRPYNEKVDVWACGVLAYELMLGGATPFYRDEPAHTEALIMQGDLAVVDFPRDQVLAPWADFVRTALVRDPARRPSAAELLRHPWVLRQAAARQRSMPRQPAAAGLERAATMPARKLSPVSLAVAPAAAPSSDGQAAQARKGLPHGGGSAVSVLHMLPGTSATGSSDDGSETLPDAEELALVLAAAASRYSSGASSCAPMQLDSARSLPAPQGALPAALRMAAPPLPLFKPAPVSASASASVDASADDRQPSSPSWLKRMRAYLQANSAAVARLDRAARPGSASRGRPRGRASSWIPGGAGEGGGGDVAGATMRSRGSSLFLPSAGSGE